MTKSQVDLRFAVGRPDGPRSAIWRLWTQDASTGTATNSDVYLGVRTLAGTTKVSLHQSGTWQYAFTSQWVGQHPQVLAALGGRKIAEWQRPAPLSPGLVLAFRVHFPIKDLRFGPDGATPNRAIHWLTPSEDHAGIEVVLMLSAGHMYPGGWPGRRSMGTIVLLKTPLASGETLWVLWRHEHIGPHLQATITTFKAHLNATLQRPLRRRSDRFVSPSSGPIPTALERSWMPHPTNWCWRHLTTACT